MKCFTDSEKHCSKRRNFYENDSHSKNGARRLNIYVCISCMEKSDPTIDSNKFVEIKSEDSVIRPIILDSGASEHAFNRVIVLSCIEQKSPILIELAHGFTVEARERKSLTLMLVITCQFLAKLI